MEFVMWVYGLVFICMFHVFICFLHVVTVWVCDVSFFCVDRIDSEQAGGRYDDVE